MRDVFRLSRGVVLMVALAGCASRNERDDMRSLPPAPLGSDVRGYQQRQMDEAMSDRFTVYRNEWTDDGDRLGDYGLQHLEEIVARAGETHHPVLIERDADAKLNEARRDYLVHYLVEHRVHDADHRVVIGRPAAAGTPGEEAIEILNARPLPGVTRGGGGSNRTSTGTGF